MISCRRARTLLVENVRGSVPEAALLQLDLHLIECAACRRERAQMTTLASLRTWAPAGLGAAARARIVDTLASAPAPATRPLPGRARPPAWAAALAASLAVATLVVALAHRPRAPRPAPLVAAPARPVRFADAELRYDAAARVVLTPETRTIALGAGDLDVRGGSAPVRVVTPRVVVRVTGHAQFAGERIRVYSGEIVVFDTSMHELATVGPGGTWPGDAPAAGRAPSLPAPSAAPRPAPSASASASTSAKANAADLIARAHAALAAGDGASARRWAHRAFEAAAGDRQRAEAELCLAESYLVARDWDRAITLYREIALSFPRAPAGEAAAFAAAQMLYERHRVDEARAALRAYVARHPDGRFAREAIERLATLGE